jgi:hypothetical protein
MQEVQRAITVQTSVTAFSFLVLPFNATPPQNDPVQGARTSGVAFGKVSCEAWCYSPNLNLAISLFICGEGGGG